MRQRAELGCFRHGSAVNRCGCGNAVAGGSGHCWTLRGDVHTGAGGLSGCLSSKLKGLVFGKVWGDVDGSTGGLGVARSRENWVFYFTPF